MANVKGIDTAHTVTQAVCDALKDENGEFVIRYYAQSGSWKKITKSEAQRIIDNGLKLVVVYQESNNSASCFSTELGTSAAQRAVSCATEIGQPTGTVIYFSVDYDATSTEIANNIIPYFLAIQKFFNDYGISYKIGVYGSGLVLKAVTSATAARYRWFAGMSTSWADYSEYDDSSKYHIKQTSTSSLAGVTIDWNITGTAEDYGAITYLNS